MKKQKLIVIILSLLCAVFLIGTLVTANSYVKALKSSKRPSGETYINHKNISEKLDSLTVEGVKYIKADNSYNLPESLDNKKLLGELSDFIPSFKKYSYSVVGYVCTVMQDENILTVRFTNGDNISFIPESLKEQYK